MIRTFALLVALLLPLGAFADEAEDAGVPEPPAHPYIEIETTAGRILVELDGEAAPYTVDRVLELVDAGYYDNTIFHRVIADFMIQAGGYTPGLELKEEEGFIPNESGNGLSHLRGTIAMARTAKPHTANAQFFINVSDNAHLNPGKNRWGYTVFGYVIEGMDVVDKIAAVETGPAKGFQSDVPIVPIVIESISRYTFQ